MADSNITKKALAKALKELMEEEDFAKISVSDICDRCGMNRKSFYYHFKDKYDLVNWIFDMEFLSMLTPEILDNTKELWSKACWYFYENKKFYRNALKIKGQNSFEEHFCELMVPFVENYIRGILKEDKNIEFYVNFYIDACIISLKRWILEKNINIGPDEYLELLRNCIHIMAVRDKDYNVEN